MTTITSPPAPWKLYLFCVLQASWILCSFGFVSLGKNASCLLLGGGGQGRSECNHAEEALLTYNALLSYYFIAPFFFLLVRTDRQDQPKQKGLGVVAIGVLLVQLGGLFFTSSGAYNAIHILWILLFGMVLIIMLHSVIYSYSQVAFPEPSSMWSSTWRAKSFLNFCMAIFLLFLLINTNGGSYSNQLFTVEDPDDVTILFQHMWSWFNVLVMDAVLMFGHVVVFGSSQDQLLCATITVVWLPISTFVFLTEMQPDLLPVMTTFQVLGSCVFIAVVFLLGVWALCNQSKNRSPSDEEHGYASVPETAVNDELLV
jgi:hypothetical protein